MKIRASMANGGSGGSCAMIHMDCAGNRVRVFGKSQTDVVASAKSYNTGNETLTINGVCTIVIDTTLRDYGVTITITPTKGFSYSKSEFKSSTDTSPSSTAGTFTTGIGQSFTMYYYNTSASRPYQIELLLWE